jgi:hypothetical protein
MASLHIYLKRRLDGLPDEHVNLLDSRYGITLVNVAPHWGLDKTVLNLIAGDFYPLMNLTRAKMARCILEELVEFIPAIDPDRDIEAMTLQPHLHEPLFLNTVGAWAARPQAVTAIDNLFMAGDHCRTDADLATMESAVQSGLNAARAILQREGRAAAVRSLPMDRPSPLLLAVLRYTPLPLVVPISLVKRLQAEAGEWQERWERSGWPSWITGLGNPDGA